MKKSLFLLLTIVIVISIFSIPSFAARNETITIWAMGVEGLTLGKIIPKFEAANPGIKVKLQQVPWGSAHEKLITSIAGGSVPDISQMGTTWMPEFMAAGVLEVLDPYLKKSKQLKLENFFEGATGTCQYAGKTFGLPWYVDTRIMFYRTDILAEVGYSKFPDTWDELYDCLKRLSERGPNLYGMTANPTNYQEFMNFVWQNGGSVLDKNGKVTVTSPAFVEALTFYSKLFKENLSLLDAGGTNNRQDLASGRLPIFIGGPWEIKLIQDEFGSQLKPDQWSIAVMPKGKVSRASFIGGCNLVVFKQSRHKAAAWKFLEFVSRPEMQVEWHRLAGALPAVKAAWEFEFFKKDSKLQTLYQQLEYGRAPEQVSQWAQIEDRLNTRLQEVCYGKRTPEETARLLAQDINNIMKKK